MREWNWQRLRKRRRSPLAKATMPFAASQLAVDAVLAKEKEILWTMTKAA